MVSGTFWDVAGRFEKTGGISADHVRKASVLKAIRDRDDVSVQALSSPRVDSGFGTSRGSIETAIRPELAEFRRRCVMSLLSFRSRRRFRRHDLAELGFARISRGLDLRQA